MFWFFLNPSINKPSNRNNLPWKLCKMMSSALFCCGHLKN
ncbi:hypothetical protein EV03_1388 [Prochlorococcus marinus str. PAC1]|uniref:Uncharacterized protein n=1 Tax=Prochlorococcus marinus str. PAC1 TaxID=59924 RepID=A0A0A2C3T5_PROMR|nr:hypothetical protein EV03_1388 [Prochlorococcus marinus str. PAC1]